MSYVLLNADIVEAIHDAVLNPGELTGRALDKSLDGALARVDNRLVYGLIEDIFDLAAAYCVAVATNSLGCQVSSQPPARVRRPAPRVRGCRAPALAARAGPA